MNQDEQTNASSNHTFLLKISTITLLVIVIFLIITNVFLLNKNRILLATSLEDKQACKNIKIELTEKNEKLRLCITDKADIHEPYNKPYTFSDFGVYSPLFVGEDISYTEIDYKDNKILRMGISPENQPWTVEVWELDQDNFHLSSLDVDITTASRHDFPIFTGYENYGSPIWISERMNQWDKTLKKYQNKENINMYHDSLYSPKTIGLVTLEFDNPISTNENQAFIILSWNVDDYDIVDPEDKRLDKYRRELEEFADTISLLYPESKN